ncbi:AAA domain-containing protein [Kribbella sp. VKM Ac-2527]|uniref:AAA domain-containing protein n=1 Tax=Kribbella caucasensis TaxID=2512215 RepID=A0A4R6KPN9_9ACTN|nr:AAA domain-containing protein [Kribbella sp. VKM Ac-2527]
MSNHWPHTIPAVAQLLTDGLDLAPGVTFLVGENGTGKSTLVEAIAIAFGLSPEGGSTGARLTTRSTESALSDDIRLTRGVGAGRAGFFLRAGRDGLTSAVRNPLPRHRRSAWCDDPGDRRLGHPAYHLVRARTRAELAGLPGRT